MPVGKVFDAREGQVYATPVDSYYRGKALRSQQTLNEQNIALNKATIENAPAKAEQDADKNKRENAEAARKGEEAAQQKGAEWMYGLTQSYAETYASVGEEEASANLLKELTPVYENMPEGEQRDQLGRYLEDGFISSDEVGNIRNVAGAMLKQFDKEAKPSQFINFRNPKDPNDVRSVRADSAEADELAKGGFIREGIGGRSVVGDNAGDVFGDPRTDSQQGAEYQEKKTQLEKSSELNEAISNALPEVLELPRTVGFSGKFAMGGAGLLTAMGQDELAAVFSEAVAGASPEAISAMQVQLQVIRGRIIPIVTGEQGKRLSEQERVIASTAVGLIDSIKGPADLTKSYPQVVGALKQLYEESWVSRYNVAKTTPQIDYTYDLNSLDGLQGILEEFASAGIDEQSARRAVTRLKTIQGVE